MKQDTGKTAEFRRLVFKDILYGNYLPGSKLPTEREMAERCGISRITVRRAYSELEKNGILERRQGSGTFVAKHKSANPDSGNITALLISIGAPFALDFIRAMEKEVSRHGGLLVLRLTDDSAELEESAAIELVEQGVRNLVIWPSGENFRSDTFARLRVLGSNMVFFDRMLPGDYADYVGVDNEDAMKVLFERAEDTSHPLFVTHSNRCYDSDFAREKSFRLECLKRNVEGRILRLPIEKEAEIPSGAFTDCSCIFAINDDMAKRLIPFTGQTPLFGIDGLYAEITSYRQPMAEMAEKVVELLYKQQDREEQWYPRRIYIKGELHEKKQ